MDELWRETVGAFPLVDEVAVIAPTARPLPTFVPYTLDNIGTVPTSTVEAQATATTEAVSEPGDESEPEHDEGSSGGGCFAAPGAPAEGGMALIVLVVGSAAVLRGVRGGRGT
jgi:hypothetical protein